MRNKILLLSLLGLFFGMAFTFSSKNYTTLELGDVMPMGQYEMKNTNNEVVSLESIRMKNGLLVVFSCNTCPFVIAWEDRYPKLAAQCKKNNIGFVLVNPNQAKRDHEDSFEAMKSHYTEKNYAWHYALDENSALANGFGAKTTPHVFLFDGKSTLRYKGAIDENSGPLEEIKKHYLHDAIDAMVRGKKINPGSTKAFGCSIKRVK